MVFRLKDIIPRQLIQIAIQAVVNGTVVARENIKPFRKDVTAKLVNYFCFINVVLHSTFSVWW